MWMMFIIEECATSKQANNQASAWVQVPCVTTTLCLSSYILSCNSKGSLIHNTEFAHQLENTNKNVFQKLLKIQ